MKRTGPVRKGNGIRLGDVGAKLKAEMERAENTVVTGAQQLQGLAGSTQARLKDTVAQAQSAISDVSALSRNGPRHVQASINRVSQRIAPETESLAQVGSATHPRAEIATVDALRSDAV